MNTNVYAHKSGPLSKAFLQVVGLTDTKLVEVEEQDSADVVLLSGTDDLRLVYNEKQLFCILSMPGQRGTSQKQPENVCVLDTMHLFDNEKGIMLLAELIAKREKTKAEKPEPKRVAPKFSDVAQCKVKYSVLVIDDKEENLEIAKQVLADHVVVVAHGLEEAMKLLGRHDYDAVLTDMEMRPDKYYPSLNLDHYGVTETVPLGFAVVLEMTRRGLPVAVVTDGNHHEGWVSAMFDSMKIATVNGQEVRFFNNIGKRWDKALKCLMEG